MSTSSDEDEKNGFRGFDVSEVEMPRLVDWNQLQFGMEINDMNPHVGKEYLDILYEERKVAENEEDYDPAFLGFDTTLIEPVKEVDWSAVEFALDVNETNPLVGEELLSKALPGCADKETTAGACAMPTIKNCKPTSNGGSPQNNKKAIKKQPSTSNVNHSPPAAKHASLSGKRTTMNSMSSNFGQTSNEPPSEGCLGSNKNMGIEGDSSNKIVKNSSGESSSNGCSQSPDAIESATASVAIVTAGSSTEQKPIRNIDQLLKDRTKAFRADARNKQMYGTSYSQPLSSPLGKWDHPGYWFLKANYDGQQHSSQLDSSASSCSATTSAIGSKNALYTICRKSSSETMLNDVDFKDGQSTKGSDTAGTSSELPQNKNDAGQKPKKSSAASAGEKSLLSLIAPRPTYISVNNAGDVYGSRMPFLLTHYPMADVTHVELDIGFKENRWYLLEIMNGRTRCWRHQQFMNGGSDRRELVYGSVPCWPYTDQQMKYILELCKTTNFCEEKDLATYADYFYNVLLPEAATKMFMDRFKMSHLEALEKIRKYFVGKIER